MKRCALPVFLLVVSLGLQAPLGQSLKSNRLIRLPRQQTAAASSNVDALDFMFTRVTAQAGFAYKHGYLEGRPGTDPRKFSGGVAAGDYDNDGLVDLFVVRGDIGPDLLFRNRGDGTFEEVGEDAGLDRTPGLRSGPLFGDFDGDGYLDLLVLGIEDARPRLFHNQRDGRFEEVTASSGISVNGRTVSAALGDIDRDGDLDLFLTRWGREEPAHTVHLWLNDGAGVFTPLEDSEAGLTGLDEFDFSLTPTFADINNDGWPDLVVSCDFGTSKVFVNRKDGTFENVTSDVISDENGMGSAVADYDNDGDLDWFVSSIWDPDQDAEGWGVTGNRLYRNLGDGTFEDVTGEAGVREGYWGWGSCFADFDNSGQLDLFHVNGFYSIGRGGPNVVGEIFEDDPSRLFMANGDGTFSEQSLDRGILDEQQGRGVVCFDYDRDGDIDIFIANNAGSPVLYRNDGGNQNHFLRVKLNGSGAGTPIGARVLVTVNGVTQMREVRVGNNFVSQQPEEVHFGLGAAASVDELRIQWPGGELEVFHNVAADQFLEFGSGQTSIVTLGHRLVFPHAPTGGGVTASVTLMNSNYSLPAIATLTFHDAFGAHRAVSLEGFGTDSSFTFQIPAGGSLHVPAEMVGQLQLGMASIVSDLPVEGVWRFEFEDAHIGVAPARLTRFGTVPVLTIDDFDTGLAIANPSGDPLFARLVLVDEAGTVVEAVEPPELNPLAGHGEFARFLTELGFTQIEGRSSGTIQIQVTQGGPFAALALVSGHGALSSTPVVAAASGNFNFEQFAGSYAGNGGMFVGVIPSIKGLSLSLDFSGLDLGVAELEAVNLFGYYNEVGFSGAGFSSVLGRVTLSIAADGAFVLEATNPLSGSLQSLVMTGTAHPDQIAASYTAVVSGGVQKNGTIEWRHSGN